MTTDYEKNVTIVKNLLSAFKSKDIPAIMSCLDENIDWQSPATGTTLKEIPWSKPRHGVNEVSSFFKEIEGKLDLDDMTYTTLVADGDNVVAEGTARGCVCGNGCSWSADWAMVITLRNGKIVRFRKYYDPANIAAAFHAKGKACRAIPKAA
jgi:ketosteroid isomerase-like protein